MPLIETELQLEELLATPNAHDIEAMQRLGGNIMVLGAGGKMGPSLIRRCKRAVEAAGVQKRVIAVSRFSSMQARIELEKSGIETIACDLLHRDDVDRLPDCANVLYLAGRKFGSTDRTDLTWASNAIVPAYVAHRFRQSRIVVFSTGNVYPFMTVASGGSVETDALDPRGEYANSCLGRERVFEYFSHEFGTKCLFFRLNYAVDLRYGVLVDIARKVYTGELVDLTVGHFNVIWQFLKGRRTFGESQQLRKYIKNNFTLSEFNELKASKTDIVVTVTNLSKNDVEYKSISDFEYN